jgi:hypothetical protein
MSLENEALVARGGTPVGDRRQRIDLEADTVRRIFRLRRRVGDDDRHGLADIAHFVERDHELFEGDQIGHGRQAQWNGGNAAVTVACHVFTREDRAHTGHRFRFGRIDRPDVAVRHRAPEDHRVHHTLPVQVVDVAAVTSEQTQVFDPLDRLADVSVARGHDCFVLALSLVCA